MKQKQERDIKADNEGFESFKIDGIYGKSPLNGQKVPLYVSEYVLDDYATGTVMGVPSFDSRDRKLANIHNIKYDPPAEEYRSLETINQIIESILKKNIAEIKPFESGSLRDWLISRQRYWGAPIPLIHGQNGGVVPEKEENLPVMLPEINEKM